MNGHSWSLYQCILIEDLYATTLHKISSKKNASLSFEEGSYTILKHEVAEIWLVIPLKLSEISQEVFALIFPEDLHSDATLPKMGTFQKTFYCGILWILFVLNQYKDDRKTL